ncbi:MAG: S41 family peptidase [Chloroflexaceae bacterium]|nr:S41 family peptidase [Chloroflexaceae bacterium]
MIDTSSAQGIGKSTPASLLQVVRLQVPLWVIAPLLGLMLATGLGGGYLGAWLVYRSTNCPEAPEVCQEFGLFWDVWDKASADFVDAEAIVPQRMTEGAINGMLDSLGDQGHTRFLSAEDARRWDESLSGEFEGIGAYLDVRNGQGMVVAPIEGSPAEKAGLLPGDWIIKVDGQETQGWTIEELVSRIRGTRGSQVVLTIQHPGEERIVDIAITRDRIEVPSVNWSMLPGDIALIRLDSFQQRATEEMERALNAARSQGARRVILDLRNNQGGFVYEAIGVASHFLPEGTPVFLEEDRTGTRTVQETHEGGVALDIPMVVLINFGTASSAEIVSGALQDAQRAQLVGVRTVGTGTVLMTYNLEGGAKLLLGTVQWLTPKGRLIRKQGIAPDIEVALPPGTRPLSPEEAASLTPEELLQSDDVQLVRALELAEVAK